MIVDEAKTHTIKIWTHSDNLSKRVQKLREHFYSFNEREETNEVNSFTTCTDWDEVYSIHDWANEPSLYPFFASINHTLKSMAVKVELPDDYVDDIARELQEEIITRTEHTL